MFQVLPAIDVKKFKRCFKSGHRLTCEEPKDERNLSSAIVVGVVEVCFGFAITDSAGSPSTD
jgi:hypothetical protein